MWRIDISLNELLMNIGWKSVSIMRSTRWQEKLKLTDITFTCCVPGTLPRPWGSGINQCLCFTEQSWQESRWRGQSGDESWWTVGEQERLVVVEKWAQSQCTLQDVPYLQGELTSLSSVGNLGAKHTLSATFLLSAYLHFSLSLLFTLTTCSAF